jgi:hypothetical protein
MLDLLEYYLFHYLQWSVGNLLIDEATLFDQDSGMEVEEGWTE